MKLQSGSELSQLLSAYLDGVLDEAQRHEVDEILARDPAARTELGQLKALRSLLSSKEKLPPAQAFWTRFSVELERRKREEENLLPFPRKYLPAVGLTGALAVLLLGFFIFQQRSTLVDFVSKQSERVQNVVQNDVLKGSLMPLFTHIDKNQALQFAMFGTLPLDAKAETELRVNEDSAKGCTIDVEKKVDRKTPAVTVKDFVDAVQPTDGQLLIIDSLLDLGRVKLQGSVLVAEDKAMAFNPDLSRLNRVMLSGIAAALEPVQRTRFEHFLQARKAPYTVAGGRRAPESPERIYYTMRTPQRTSHYVVISPDSVLLSPIDLDMDSLRLHFAHAEELQATVTGHVNNLMRRMAERDMAMNRRSRVAVPHVRVSGDSESLTIQVSSGWEGMPSMPMDPWVRPRMATQVGRRAPQPPNLFDMRMSGDDSSFFFNFDLDSLMIHLGKEGNGGAIEVFKGDPRARSRVIHFDERGLQQFLDSAYQGRKHKISKLDSLMNEMDKRERLQKEREVPEPR